MFIGCACLLIANFLTEPPRAIVEHLSRTNETHGTFVQTKTLPAGEKFVSRGNFRIRPGKDFEWRVTDPFDSLFWTDRSKCVYSNEDERVERDLADLPQFSRLADVESGDFSAFFKAFDCLYKEDDPGNGDVVFHVLAKPRESRLSKVLKKVEADGTLRLWTLKATFPDGTVFSIRFDTSSSLTPQEK